MRLENQRWRYCTHKPTPRLKVKQDRINTLSSNSLQIDASITKLLQWHHALFFSKIHTELSVEKNAMEHVYYDDILHIRYEM